MNERFPSQISLVGVSRAFRRNFALHRIDLEIRAGSITALAGDNGAGKTTLLNLLATVDEPTHGQIRYGDLSQRRFARSARQRIGWVSHHSLVYDELTARENLHFFCRMYGLQDFADRSSRWLERVGLAAEADRRVANFSRGMKQRLTIARSLLHNPQVCLFDEPATGLDQQGNRFVTGLLRSLRERGRIVVLVTHDFELLADRTDRIIILRRGRVSLDALNDDSFDLGRAYEEYA